MTEENVNCYLPLFRKYRPQSFKDVIGQDFTVKALTNAIKLNKIANAYLFCGPRGTGKTSSARIFAKSLNCVNGPTVEPCQTCRSCLDVTNASGLDVIEIDAATNRGIDDAKELISKVQYAPMNGKYKIFIIDEVHMLSKEAFNALLKTFEEPPANVIFILATTEPHKVIETIVSRCQRFDFRRITVDDIVKRLREISDIEKINITDDALYSIAKNVSGGMRDSLALLDQASILGTEKEITKEVIESLIGKLTFDVLYDLTKLILSKDIENSVKAVEKIYEKGSEPRNFVENFIEFLRNLVLVLSSKNDAETSSLTLFSAENIQKIKSDSLFEQKKVIKILDKVIEFYKEIKNSTNPYLWAELMIINITSDIFDVTSSSVSYQPSQIKAVSEAFSSPKSAVETKNVSAPVIKKAEPENQIKENHENKIAAEILNANDSDFNKTEPPLENEAHLEKNTSYNEDNPSKIWADILNKVESIPAKFFYSGVGKLISVKDKHITLGFINQNALGQAKSDNKYNPLLKAIKLILGDEGGIEFVTVNENTKIIDTKINVKINSPAQSGGYSKPQEQKQITEKNDENPVFPNSGEQEHTEFHREKNTDTETDSNTADISSYTRMTKDMLESYRGRLIE